MIELKVPAGVASAVALTSIKAVALKHPGDHELRLFVVRDGEVKRTLTLGPMWACDASPAAMAALGEFGSDVRLAT